MNNVLFIDPGQLTSELALEAMQPLPDESGRYLICLAREEGR
ncbi:MULTISPECIES: hypothetical protein [unclassified Brucella]|nr:MULTISPECIES: hypothetical protein [unclassified Brucella]